MSESELYLRGCIISFENKSLTLLHSDESLTTYTLTEDLRIRVQRAKNGDFSAPSPVTRVEQPLDARPPDLAASSASTLEADAKKTVTLTGVIKGALRPGRVDGKGQPTIWARFSAHREGSPEAWMLSTTFHRAAAKVAAEQLTDGIQATLAGYIRPSDDPQRMDSFSVFHVVSYRDQPPRE